MSVRVTLREHLQTVDQNAQANEKNFESLKKRMKKKFKECGYPNASKNDTLVMQYIHMIFKTQDYRCTHWIPVKEGELNGVWNRPHPGYRGWKADYIMYEIDHIHPVNAGGGEHLQNFQFLSANANEFVKCSLTIEDLLKRVDLSGVLKRRIARVMKRRERLFATKKWQKFMDKMNKLDPRPVLPTPPVEAENENG